MKDPVAAGPVEPNYNFLRSHSRQAHAYGIAFHVTGNSHYLELCRKRATALVEAMDGNNGMHVAQSVADGQWNSDRMVRTSQDLAYGLTVLGMYYFLTHDIGIIHRVLQIKDYVFKAYMDDGRGYLACLPKHKKRP